MTKSTFDLILITLLLWQPAKGLAKMWAAREAADGDGWPQTVAQAGLVIL